MTKGFSEVRVSWSGLTKLLSCPRSYELAYIDRLEAKPSAADRSRILGSAFHAGIAAHFMGENPIAAARDTLSNPPQDLAPMYNELVVLVGELLSYYLPDLSDYKIVYKDEIVPTEPHEPAVEWKIEVPFDNYIVTGIIDAVVRDTLTGEVIIMDWKLRSQFLPMDISGLDGQLHFYAAALNQMAGKQVINSVCQWQFRAKLPSPASISLRNSKPNTGAESYDTTWRRWCETLPAGIDPSEYEELMKPKMKNDGDFSMPTLTIVTPTSNTMAIANTQAAVYMLKALKNLDAMPALMSSMNCKFCEFSRLCSGALRYGGNIQPVVDEYYNRKAD